MSRVLADGFYEHLITESLGRALDALDPNRQQTTASLDTADAPVALARHFARELERILSAFTGEERTEASRELTSTLFDRLAELAAAHGLETEPLVSERVTAPARQLLAIHRVAAPARPATPLGMSTLLTRNRREPSLGHELAREVASADRVDAVLAFITVGGVRSILDGVESFSRNKSGEGRMRILTTTFTGTTEVAALETLARLPGVSVKVSYDTRRTRLHAKAWLFRRDTGLTTAYIGSANFTKTALGAGQEWMVKVCAADLPHVIVQFQGAFDTLWNDPEFELYDPNDIDMRARLQAALGLEQRDREGLSLSTLISLRPYPFQEEILDRLAAERAIHGRSRNLIVAATGTGKTVIAAFDYARVARVAGIRPRLLFLAHRREILVQARDTFRHVLQDASFGELLTGDDRPERFDHVFATIQSTDQSFVEKLGADYFRHVIVDECHHLPAKSYQLAMSALRPELLVGLTATPERSDGKSLLGDFDGHVAAELRLWHALERQLLVPFEYYGISDGVDLRQARWSRAGYDLGSLSDIYTGHNARADLVLQQLRRRVSDLRRVRGLGFCTSVAHAEFMASRFTAAGVPSVAVHGGSSVAEREEAPRRLREREINVIFTCDLYNEGVDLPFVDTLLLLRPTTSATLFLQQLGRGLRHDSDKATCLVLDFIGQHREEFRFDGVLSALSGVPRAKLRSAVEEGFPYLPSGCALQLDAVARETILHGLRTTVATARRLAAELSLMSPPSGGTVSLRQFLEETGREIEEVYGNSHSWTKIRRLAGLLPNIDDETEDLSRRLGWLLHLDEPERLRSHRKLLRDSERGQTLVLEPRDRTRLVMMEFQLNHKGVLRAAEETLSDWNKHPTIVNEFEQMSEVLESRVGLPNDVYPVPEWPLSLHRHYQRREIVAAVGHVRPGQKGNIPQGGILMLQSTRRELLFVTLDKSGRGFSPSTRYRDFALSNDLFHWETQGEASISTKSGRRYTESATNGWSFYLFVRTDPDSAYAFLGPVKYESHTGDRPIAITWRLETPMPGVLFDRYATLSV